MMIPVLLGVMIITFTIGYLTPGCPATMRLGDTAAPEAILELRTEMGLEDPFIVRFGTYIFNLVFRFDLGRSFQNDRPITQELLVRFPNTARLAVLGVTLAVVMGIPLGIIAAVRQYTIFDTVATFTGLLGASLPNFWLGLMLILFFTVNLGWLPASGFATWQQMIMPTITIGTGSAAIVMRMTRSNMLEVIRQDYIRTAKAKGQKESTIIFKHALKNAIIPVVTVVGLQLGFLLGGAILTENVFSIPGIGSFILQAIFQRDFPVMLGGVFIIATVFSFANLAVDLLYGLIDPRIRSQLS